MDNMFKNMNNQTTLNNNLGNNINYQNTKISESSGYIRPKETAQDLISKNPEEIAKKLDGFVQIHPENYGDIECGVWIKYITQDKKYRSGGLLKINKAPDYFILKSPYNNISWSVGLDRNIIFMRGQETKLTKMVEKNNLYKLYEAGLIQIVENAYIDEDGDANIKTV